MPEGNLVTNRIVELLKISLLLNPQSPDSDLVETGLIDSAGFMELFAILEEEFDIVIEVNDLILENFRTVRHMAAFVALKIEGGSRLMNGIARNRVSSTDSRGVAETNDEIHNRTRPDLGAKERRHELTGEGADQSPNIA